MSDYTSATVATIAAGDEVLDTDIDTWHDALQALVDGWTDYTPSVNWTSAGTAPVLNNGTISARYKRIGKTVFYQGKITMGSTTTYGSANAWQVNLPANAQGLVCGSATIFDTDTTANKNGASVEGNSTVLTFFSKSGPVAATVPHTWAVGDHLSWFLVYETA